MAETTDRARGLYFRNGIAYIRFKDRNGKIMRESTEQRSHKFALDLLAKRKTEVAGGRRFPTREFVRVRFAELLDHWWEKHGKQTRSRFDYHLPKVRQRFWGKRARDIRPDDIEAARKVRLQFRERRPAEEGASRPRPVPPARGPPKIVG